MALGRDDSQPAFGLDLVVQTLPLVVQLVDAARLFVGGNRIVGVQELDLVFDVAAQHDVRAPAGHVGGDGDDGGALAGIGHDFGFTGA